MPAPPHKRASASGVSAPRHVAVRVRSPSDPLDAAGSDAGDAHSLSTVREDSAASETPGRRELAPLLGVDVQPDSGGGSGLFADGGGGSGQFAAGVVGADAGREAGGRGGAATAGRRTPASTIDMDDEGWLQDDSDKVDGCAARWRRRCSVLMPLLFAAAALAAAFGLRLVSPKQTLMHLPAWQWCLFAAATPPLWCITAGAMRGIITLVESRWLDTYQAAYYIVSIREPALQAARAALLLPLFVVVFGDEPPTTGASADAAWTWTVMMKVLVCLVIAAGANVLKTLAAKLLAMSFHRQAHFDKMQDALSKEYFLLALSQPRPELSVDGGASPVGTPLSPCLQAHLSLGSGKPKLRSRRAALSPAHGRKTSVADEFADFLAEVRRGVAHGVRATSRLPLHASRSFSQLLGQGAARSSGHHRHDPRRTASPRAAAAAEELEGLNKATAKGGTAAARLARMERHMRERKLQAATLTERLARAGDQGEADEVNSSREAKQLAFYLFWNVRPPDNNRQHVTLEDLNDFLPPDKAAAALATLDVDHDGAVSLHDMRDAVLQIYNERKHLAFTLADAKSVVARLETLLAVAAHAAAALLYLLIFRVDVGRVWLTFSSCLLAFVFVFGNNIRNVYESVIFLFAVHPFDVGDVILHNDKDWCNVEEIGLLNTVVVRWDGVKLWLPNVRLAEAPLPNVSRSNDRWEGFKVAVDISTPPEVFEAVKADLEVFMAENPTEYSGKFLCVANFAGDPLKFTLCVWWGYSHPGVELGRMSLARHALYMRVAGKLGALKVAYTLPPYQGMGQPPLPGGPPPLRPPGEGADFMPAFAQRGGLRL